MLIHYKKWNNILGWLIFIVAAAVYILTSEPTASFWDCGEYIATSYKLQVGHPPGAPFFQLIGRFFSLFAFNDVSNVARMVNTMSALASGLTILFLFWTITLLGKKLVKRNGELTDGKIIAIFGSAVVGALAYTFSDSFWFSAVEGEVYASSSFYTAITFWAILKWDENADEKHSFRWLILIAYLIGLSIGVHLLNLLAIPAIVFVYYFRKFKTTRNGVIISMLLALILLVGVLYGIIPEIVSLSGFFERMVVNSFGLPFGSGTIVYFAILIAAILWGLWYSKKHHKVVLNSIILSLVFLLIGYSSFFILVIRSNANPPIDENNPDNATALVSYLEREQYGSNPVFYGQYYNAPIIDYKDGNPVYTKAYLVMSGNQQQATFFSEFSAKQYIAKNANTPNLSIKGKYIITDDKKGEEPVYDPRFTTVFPRMYSSGDQGHINAYKDWGKVKGTPITVQNRNGEPETILKPTFRENLRYFFTYQLNYMYFRYFMWNFAGRQNDLQGRGDILNGNWISGIPFVDQYILDLGPQDNVPANLQNHGTNKFYLLPLILGLIGLFFHMKKDISSGWVVALLFFLTGIAIVIYLNQYAYQPRERDYAFAASFYAFAIWIGLGVYAIFDFLSKKIDPKLAAIVATTACTLLVPTIMAKEGWDDHNRSNRFTALHFAENYLNSCAPNAILFTNGDNDTFPLWYAQEVEGIRTDIRVINLSLLNTDWYVDQAKRKAYNSDPVPFSLTKEQYIQGTRDFVLFDKSANTQGIYVNIKEAMRFIADNNNTRMMSNQKMMSYFPTDKFSIPVDKNEVIKNGVVPASLKDSILDAVNWTMNGYGVQKAQLMQLDLLANFDWKRPVYFAITTGDEAYIGLENYFQLEGLAYRLVPMKAHNTDGQQGTVNTSIMYDNLMHKYKWGNMTEPKVYMDETNMRMTMNFRNIFARLANALLDEGKKDSAIKVLDRCFEIMPESKFSYNMFVMPLADVYYKAGQHEKANKILKRLLEINKNNLTYYYRFTGSRALTLDYDKRESLGLLNRIKDLAERENQKQLSSEIAKVFEPFYQMYMKTAPPQQQQ
ncbi:MAG: protein O-mannosyl-transferase family [Bacteroidales bacterium]